MRILLVRHGSPEFNHAGTIESDGLRYVLNQYAQSIVIDVPGQEFSVLKTVSRDQVAVSSELARARSSAALLGFGNVTTSPLLNEALLPHPDALPCRLPWRIVLLLCRLAWFFGYQRNAAGIRSDKERAEEAAAWLVDLARSQDDVVAFGHGIMNRLIARSLTANGWQTESSSGGGYWSCLVLYQVGEGN